MKIGIFDSGLGGLIITNSFMEELKDYDFIYLGDTKNLPYGDKKPQEILNYTIDAMKYLISQDCKLIIIACNTATSIALRYLQRIFLPSFAPDVRILGVVIPTVEEALKTAHEKIGVIATQSTVNSHIYRAEIMKLNPNVEVIEIASPELVPLIESNNFSEAEKQVEEYAQKFKGVESLILGCTHYPALKKFFQKNLPDVNIISQADFMGNKLKTYLNNHPEIDSVLDKQGRTRFLVTKQETKYNEIDNIIIKEISIANTDKH